jgi:tRNA pseudouridine55 synthase
MDGIILIDKPAGRTSAELVRAIKRLVRGARVGHLGTLDPFATGLLPIMIGEGTKLAPFVQETPKVYSGKIIFGAETDTLDPTGTVIRVADVPDLAKTNLFDLARRFTGEIEQVPPIFSAIKRDGVPLYKLARRSGDVPPPPSRRVTIHSLILVPEQEARIRFIVTCSAGTYIRSLARDIGCALNSAAHLGELRRIRCGIFGIERAYQMEEVLAAIETGQAADILIGMRESLSHLPEAEVDGEIATRLRNGDSRALDFLAPPNATMFKVVAGGSLIAVAEVAAPAISRLLRGFNPAHA